MEIKAGNKFMCIKDVVMYNTGRIAYYANRVYESERDGCITEENGNKDHYWLEKDKTENYFKPYAEKPLYWFVGNEKNGKMLLREMERLADTFSYDDEESESGENLFYYDRVGNSIVITHNNGVIAEMIKERGEEVTLPEREENSSVLEDAQRILGGYRESDYGDAVANFERISAMARLMGAEVTPVDCCKVLMAVKICRESYRHKRDNLVDLAGYSEILNQIEDGSQGIEQNKGI